MLPFIILGLGLFVVFAMKSDAKKTATNGNNVGGGSSSANTPPTSSTSNDLVAGVGAAISVVPGVVAAGKAIATAVGGTAAVSGGTAIASGATGAQATSMTVTGSTAAASGAKTAATVASVGGMAGYSAGFGVFLGVAAVVIITAIITSEILAANIAYNRRFSLLANVRRIVMQMHIMEAELLSKLAAQFNLKAEIVQIEDRSLDYEWLAGTQRMTTRGYRTTVKVSESVIEVAPSAPTTLKFGTIGGVQAQQTQSSVNQGLLAQITAYKEAANIVSLVNRSYWVAYTHQAMAIALAVWSQVGGYTNAQGVTTIQEYDRNAAFEGFTNVDAFIFAQPYANLNGVTPKVLPWEAISVINGVGAFRAFLDAARIAKHDTTIWLEGDKLKFPDFYMNKMGFGAGDSLPFRTRTVNGKRRFIANQSYWKIDREVEFDFWEIRTGLPGVYVL